MRQEFQRRERFEALVDHVYDPLQRYLRRRVEQDTADDLLADVLATVWRRLDDVPSGRELPWCYGIARNTVANERRRRRRQVRLVERLRMEPSPVVPDPGEAGPDVELVGALASLGRMDQEILRLWAWEQLEPREIAPALGLTVNAATVRLSRARARLARQLAGKDADRSGHKAVEGTREQR